MTSEDNDRAQSVVDGMTSGNEGTQRTEGSQSADEGTQITRSTQSTQSIEDGSQSVKPDFMTISVQRGRCTGEEYFAIGVTVSTRLDGDNKIDLRVNLISGAPGQPDPSVFAGEAESMRMQTARVLFGRADRRTPTLPEIKDRLAAYQARWREICQERPPRSAGGYPTSFSEEESHLRYLAYDAFNKGWTKLDQDTQDILLQKRRKGTTDTSPLDQLAQNVEIALVGEIQSEILNSLLWSPRLSTRRLKKELHFFRYTSEDELLRPRTLTYPYKLGGACISHQGTHQTLAFNENVTGLRFEYEMDDSSKSSSSDNSVPRPRSADGSGSLGNKPSGGRLSRWVRTAFSRRAGDQV